MPAALMPTLRPLHLALLASTLGCTDRTEPASDLGRVLALHLCPIQADCGCEMELLIPNCEAQVEQAVAESESRALAAGLALDQACLQQTLESIDALGTCGVDGSPLCPVYNTQAGEGETCEIYDFVPGMTECRPGLQCIQGVCRDPNNPPILGEGEVCSETQAIVATGWLGQCDEGLRCDSMDTRLCVLHTPVPPTPLGEACTMGLECVEGGYCLPQGTDYEASEEAPGVCVPVTPPGEPCTRLYECDGLCTDGFCELPAIRMCETLEIWWAARRML